MHLQGVRVRVDVDDLAEAGVRGRAVVALEEVIPTLPGTPSGAPIRVNQSEGLRSIREDDEGVDGDGVVGPDDERVDLD